VLPTDGGLNNHDGTRLGVQTTKEAIERRVKEVATNFTKPGVILHMLRDTVFRYDLVPYRPRIMETNTPLSFICSAISNWRYQIFMQDDTSLKANMGYFGQTTEGGYIVDISTRQRDGMFGVTIVTFSSNEADGSTQRVEERKVVDEPALTLHLIRNPLFPQVLSVLYFFMLLLLPEK
jgi:hypothetical protein